MTATLALTLTGVSASGFQPDVFALAPPVVGQ